jgi:soluble cytochrome b562
MKSLSRLLAVLTVIFAGSVAFAADAAPAAPAKEKKEDTELTKKMDKMNAAYRKLKKQAADATKNAESLQLVATMREYATAGSKLEPLKLTEIPEADRAKMLEGYKAKMKDFLAGIDKLEAALKAGQNDEAVKLVQALGAMQKEGHKEYKSKSID